MAPVGGVPMFGVQDHVEVLPEARPCVFCGHTTSKGVLAKNVFVRVNGRKTELWCHPGECPKK